MKNVIKIARQIIVSKTLTNLPSIKVDFSTVKRKIESLESEISSFRGEDTTWEVIESWKPSIEEIIRNLEDIEEKL